MTSAALPMDFAPLLSREYRPALLAQLQVKERGLLLKRREVDGDEDDVVAANSKDKTLQNKYSVLHNVEEQDPSSKAASSVKNGADDEADMGRFALQLVRQTPAYSKYLPSTATSSSPEETETALELYRPKTVVSSEKPFPSSFHQVELANWEQKIQWGGKKETENSSKSKNIDAVSLLQKRRNPLLDNFSFDNKVSWTGSKSDALQKAMKIPLVFELGVTGRSIASHVLPSHRPLPCVKSEEYQARIQNDWTGDMSAAEISRGTLHADKDKMERLIAQRQEKRRLMAKAKTSRVKDAMNTLDVLAGGKGRTITSSLMGPGGTERTGRPSRHVGNASHDTEYIEQLDIVTNHVLFRDMSVVTLRQYHRPKLPWSVVRTSLIWQFSVRYAPTNKKGGPPTAQGENSSSYQAMMMGTHAGAVSKAKLRSEADLSPTEGNLVLLEYSEERPPIQLTKGMASKIVTYYRGDKARCPVSAGGGDRPTRRKRVGAEAPLENNGDARDKSERPPRLVGPDKQTSITDWVGKVPKKSREDRDKETSSIDVLPEGVTEILHPKVHGPFVGEIEEGQSMTGLLSNLFVAPLFRHEPEQTDFLMILGRNAGASIPGRHENLGVVLRELPTSVFTVGQTEPRNRVYAPNTQGDKTFMSPFVSYQIAKALSRAENRDGHGLRFDEIQERVLPSLKLAGNALRQRLKHVAIYDKNTQIWTTKHIGYEEYEGIDVLGKKIAPEGVAAYGVASAATRRLRDLGIHKLFMGSHAVSSVGVTMVYLAGQVNAARELARKHKKLLEVFRANKKAEPVELQFYEESAAQLETISKALRKRHEVAKFIYEELQLAPWHLTGEFIDVHKKGEGTGMMKLTGLGDPSGIGEGFSFIREVDTKPSKSVGAGTMSQSAQMKKITGTEDDLRKLTMKQMAAILQSYGMKQKQINTLKRWDRVHVIRDLSTKAASDGVGDGLERFARGEKMKLSEQKQMYRDRIQVIWKRQIAALSADLGDGRAMGVDGGTTSNEADETDVARAEQLKKDDGGNDDSDSESEDDEMAAQMEEEMMDHKGASALVAAQTRDTGTGDLGQLHRTAAQDQDLNKDAQALAALKRQREEERATREGLSSTTAIQKTSRGMPIVNRKIIRKRITKTHPDGRQTVTFKFIVHPEEVGKIMARLQSQKPTNKSILGERPEYAADEKQIGHAMFEDEDDYEFTTRGRNHGHKRRGGGRRGRVGGTAKAMPRKKDLQFGKLKTKISKEQRLKKRMRDEEEADLYAPASKRRGTNNRKNRGSIRDRRPHVILADRLEAIRALIEVRPSSIAFVKPVSRRQYPMYYERISNPIDLATIRDKNQKYEYRTADSFLKDFALMKSNAIKFNGPGHVIAEEGAAIYQIVKDKIEEGRGELTHLEQAVEEQLSIKPKKKKKKNSKGSPAGSNAGSTGEIENFTLPLDFNVELSDSD